jgi:mitochondrial GTPase 1
MASRAVATKAGAGGGASGSFIPRTTFPALDSLRTRPYFPGHQRSGLENMKGRLGLVDLVVECRDYRAPITSRNPLLDVVFKGKDRIVVYTKGDVGREEDPQKCAANARVSYHFIVSAA